MSEYQIGQDITQLRIQLAEMQNNLKEMNEAIVNIFGILQHNIKENNLVEPTAAVKGGK